MELFPGHEKIRLQRLTVCHPIQLFDQFLTLMLDLGLVKKNRGETGVYGAKIGCCRPHPLPIQGGVRK